jgi:O-Antigen ligase
MSNTALLFLVLFFVGLLLAFVKHPIYGMLSYMLVFYMGPGEAWWVTDVPDLRWSLVAAAVTMIAAMRHPSPSSRPPWYTTAPARWLIVIALWLWIQTPWALSPSDHVFMASLFSKYLLLYAVLYTTLCEPKDVRHFVFAHIVGCFLWGYTAYLHPGSGRLENIGYGDVAGSAFASMHMGTGLAFAGFAFLGTSGIRRWLAFSSIPFILNAIILMATRGGFVGLLAGAPMAIYFSPKSRRRTVMLCLAMAPVLLVTLAHELFWSRMSTMLESDTLVTEGSAGTRIAVARANIEMFLDHPWGAGHRGNDLLSPRYLPPELLSPKDGTKDGEPIRSAHNTLLAVLVDHGFIGLMLFVLLHISVARRLMRIKFHSSSPVAGELGAYAAALCTSLVIYWGNAQFTNSIKAEVVIWIAALGCALEWMANATRQSKASEAEVGSPSENKSQSITIPSERLWL